MNIRYPIYEGVYRILTIKDMLQEKTAKYFLKYRHDGRTSHLTGRNKNMGWK